MLKLPEGTYFGEMLFQQTLNKTIFTYSKYNPNRSIPVHYHPNLILGYVVNGHYHEKMFKETNSCTPGTMIIQPAASEHSNNFLNSGADVLNIELTSDRVLELREMDIGFHTRLQVNTPEINFSFRRIIREIQSPDLLSTIIIEALLMDVLATATRNSKSTAHYSPYKLRKIKTLIDEDPSRNFSLDELSKMFSLSSFHLAREFKRVFQFTPGEYARKKRIERAMHLLHSKHLRISAIACDCGFTDASHLIRIFKKITGLTPDEYRRSI
ncbi:MAG: helix-turn-helix domain-containing protein [Chitinophagaceae bacterium]